MSVTVLSFEKYEQQARAIGGGHWSNYSWRWTYHRIAADIVRMIKPPSASAVLEMGTMGIRIVEGSDTIDYPGLWQGFDSTYAHDARLIPWPVPTKKYHTFIALRVFHHLFPRQRECFEEAARIAENIIIVCPQIYNVKDYESSHGIAEEEFVAWNDGNPPTICVELSKEIGKLYFWNSESIRDQRLPILAAETPGKASGS